MGKERAREAIHEILKNHSKKGTYLYGKPIPTYQAILGVIVEDGKIRESLSYSEFEHLLSDFKKNPQKTVDSFFKKLKIPSEPFFIADFKIKKLTRPKGEKITRDKHWESFKNTWEFLNYSNSSEQFERNLIRLIKFKNYLIEKGKRKQEYTYMFSSPFRIKGQNEDPYGDWGYICQMLGISFDKYFKDPKLKQFVSKTNSFVLDCIKHLKFVLGYIPILIDEKPYTRPWIIDVFGEATVKHYRSDLIRFKRKSQNPPDFNSSYKKFIKFINGTTPKELGYTNRTYHHFTNRVAPQGIIVLMHKVHELLYGEIDQERAFLQRKINQVNDILKDVPPETTSLDILPKLSSDYFKKLPPLGDLLPRKVK